MHRSAALSSLPGYLVSKSEQLNKEVMLQKRSLAIKALQSDIRMKGSRRPGEDEVQLKLIEY